MAATAVCGLYSPVCGLLPSDTEGEKRMEPNRTDGDERDKQRKNRQPDNPQLRARAEHDDDLDGQLGPDELPDPVEVVMNLEAKRHH